MKLLLKKAWAGEGGVSKEGMNTFALNKGKGEVSKEGMKWIIGLVEH